MPSRRSALNCAVLAAAIGLGVMAGCSEESAPTESAGAGEPAPAAVEEQAAEEQKDSGAASPIAIGVTADKTHALQPSDEIRIEVSVEGFVLDGAKIGADAQPGVGHYHVYLGSPDGEPLLVSADASAVVKCRRTLPTAPTPCGPSSATTTTLHWIPRSKPRHALSSTASERRAFQRWPGILDDMSCPPSDAAGISTRAGDLRRRLRVSLLPKFETRAGAVVQPAREGLATARERMRRRESLCMIPAPSKDKRK